MRHRTHAGILAALLLAGCSKTPSKDKATNIDADDPQNAAVQKARSTIDQFTTALASPKPSQSAFSVRVPFKDGDSIEHMWLAPVSYDGQAFRGTVNGDPIQVSTVKAGQEVTVAPPGISDWMFVDDGKLVGGYSFRAMRDALPPLDQAEFDKSMPFSID